MGTGGPEVTEEEESIGCQVAGRLGSWLREKEMEFWSLSEILGLRPLVCKAGVMRTGTVKDRTPTALSTVSDTSHSNSTMCER